MIAVVTGAAGFIGSTLVDALLAAGWTVRGIDAFTDYYDTSVKRSNLTGAFDHEGFALTEDDLLVADLDTLLDGADVVFHQAGQPGVRLSWAEGFGAYVRHNIEATQRLLETARHHPLRRLVYASSSSVYGNAMTAATPEEAPTAPFSPYGVTKLAGEHLCVAYATNFGVPTVALRYFTVYGPRQRPDMATFRLVEAALGGPAFPMFGDGSQVRDFTYVGDIADANILAAGADVDRIAAGTVLNVAGGSSTTLAELIELVGETAGSIVPIERLEQQAGDVVLTSGATDRIRSALGWAPSVSLRDGVLRQVEWHRGARSGPADEIR